MFYVLESPISEFANPAVTDFLMEDGFRTGDAPRCPVCGGVVGMLTWLPPFRVEIECFGKLHGDIAFGTAEMLVTERFIDLFKKEGLTGLDVLGRAHVSKIVPKAMGRNMPKYYVTRVVRSRTSVDHEASGIEYEEPWTCGDCKVGLWIRLRQLVIKQETWQGEDLFVARDLPGICVASQRFSDWCIKYEIKNANLIEASNFTRDYS
ncbi:MAG: hypothetical protein NDJ18_02280 [candidate division Zixibacteria bacterium]|nr:hypothetical protein [candidate division Zixibacteria bacterium]